MTAGRPRLPATPARIARRKRYARMVRKRLCIAYCGLRAAPGRRLCTTCAGRAKRAQRDRAQVLVAAGLCRVCGVNSYGRHHCPECAEKRNAQPSRQTRYRSENERHGRRDGDG